MMNHLPMISAVVAGLMTAAGLFKPFFGQEDDFWECLVYSFKPNFISWLDGSIDRDYWKSFKFGTFLLICGGVAFGVHEGVQALMA